MFSMMLAQRQQQKWTTSRHVFGLVISNHRHALKMTQARFCKECRLTQPTLSRIERGFTTASISELLEIATFLSIRPSSILAECERIAEVLEGVGIQVYNLPISCGVALPIDNSHDLVLRRREDLDIDDMLDIHELRGELRRTKNAR